ncbi:DUF2905 domain-containing protein [Desulfurispora thermophila]|uniref:DUF2905 domain-containing protein n=1 Tax=Desulfurispora thermophila TaxID=265470 RepID=UPI000368710A|nr:DUF2905 domain-containing protein [Desulfurispora thermophila]
MTPLDMLGRVLLWGGLLLAMLGLLLLWGGKFLSLGRLPGDIVWQRGPVTFYFPIVTCIVLSLLLTLLLNFFFRR